jgi:hypothetical protein
MVEAVSRQPFIHAMFEAVSRQVFSSGIWVHSTAVHVGFVVGSDPDTGFSPSTSAFPWRLYHSTDAPYSSTHLPNDAVQS